MRRIILISLMSVGTIGCESAPPDTELCVASPIQGAQLRLMVGYFDDGALVETTHDQPFAQRTCLTLRRPTVAARPQTVWEVELDAQGRIERPVWPLDVAIYDDLNGNETIDAGELRGSLSAEEGRLPALLLDYEEIAKNWASIDEADDVSLALREFVWARVLLNPLYSASKRAFERLPKTVQVNANANACSARFYPVCFARELIRSAPRIVVLDAENLDETVNADLFERFESFAAIWPIYEITAPAIYCEAYDEYLVASFAFEEWSLDAESCACVRTSQAVNLYTGLESAPEWLDCSAAADRNDTYIIGLQAEPSVPATSTAQSSE